MMVQVLKKRRKRCRDAVFYSPTEKKNILLCLIIFQLESWPQSTEMHEKTALSGIKCQWNFVNVGEKMIASTLQKRAPKERNCLRSFASL